MYWRGTTATLARNVPGVALYFALLQHFRYLSVLFDPHGKILVDRRTGKMTNLGNLLTGGVARASAGFLLMPATVLKTMFESNKFKDVSGFAGMARTINSRHGLYGFFRGFWPTAIRDAPHTAIYVAIYERLGRDQHHQKTIASTAVNALAAGALATIVTQPLDTVKTSVQLGSSSGMRQAIVDIFKRDGIAGFYLGTLPRFLRKTTSSAITWTVYEYLVSS
jgi:solute carrier family 25 protein 38